MTDSVTETRFVPIPWTFPVTVDQLLSLCLTVRGLIVAPVLQVAIYVCVVMVIMLSAERIYMCGAKMFVKLLGRTPESVYKFQPIQDIQDDLECGNSKYPMVLVQIPMYNEREVYQLSIKAACCLQWPADRMIVQVLDDSADPLIKELVQTEVQRWTSKGINIKYETRPNRKGYKAGALRQGMLHSYVQTCEHVAIFDADFQPESDFLMRTIPFLSQNPQIALVQARWTFVNGDECLMTKMQEVSLNYHFSVEQRVGSATYGFFGFNGTAGVWRIRAMEEAGGWNERTTVEDMDLAVRAGLCGWKFVYLHDLEVKSELPSTFPAFRFQQHRWSCGPANLFRKMWPTVLANRKLNLWLRIHMFYNFFLVHKIVSHIVTFTFYCLVIPATVLVPEVDLPLCVAVYLPSIITLLNAITTPKSLHLMVFWIFFENVMSLHRTKATLIGLFDIGNVNEWVVTEKLGNLARNMLVKRWKLSARIYVLELLLGVFLMFCAVYNYCFQGRHHFFLYLFPQACAFIVMGMGYVGTVPPS